MFITFNDLSVIDILYVHLLSQEQHFFNTKL